MRTTIDSYKSRAGRLDLEGIDFDDFRDQPLSPDARQSTCETADLGRPVHRDGVTSARNLAPHRDDST